MTKKMYLRLYLLAVFILLNVVYARSNNPQPATDYQEEINVELEVEETSIPKEFEPNWIKVSYKEDFKEIEPFIKNINIPTPEEEYADMIFANSIQSELPPVEEAFAEVETVEVEEESIVEEELVEQAVVSETVIEEEVAVNEIPQTESTQTSKNEWKARNYIEPDPNVYDIIPAGNFRITGYDPLCKHCCGKANGITSSGAYAEVGHTVANNQYPAGTMLYIVGYGVYYVEDTGGMSNTTIDIACSSHNECYSVTGNAEVYVLQSK